MFIVRYMNDKFFFPNEGNLTYFQVSTNVQEDPKKLVSIYGLYIYIYIYICAYGLTYWRATTMFSNQGWQTKPWSIYWILMLPIIITTYSSTIKSLCSQLKFNLAPIASSPAHPAMHLNKKIRSFPSPFIHS